MEHIRHIFNIFNIPITYISGNFKIYAHPQNINAMSSTLEVFHFDISGKYSTLRNENILFINNTC